MAGELTLDDVGLKSAQSLTQSLVGDSIKGRTNRKGLKANFPDSDIGSIGLTPYGLALMTSWLVQFEVIKRESLFSEMFGNDATIANSQDQLLRSLVERTIEATQDQLFAGIPPNVSLVPCDEWGFDCRADLGIDQLTPTDMGVNLLPILLVGLKPLLLGGLKQIEVKSWKPSHKSRHCVDAFCRYGMGCSTFHPSFKAGYHVQELQLMDWFVGPLTAHDHSLNAGFGLIA
jgi:hypothetical protein